MWNIFNSFHTNIKFHHWAVIIFNVDKQTIETSTQEQNSKDGSGPHFGCVHELCRAEFNADYHRVSTKAVRTRMRLTFVGYTTLTDDEINEIGK